MTYLLLAAAVVCTFAALLLREEVVGALNGALAVLNFGLFISEGGW